MSKQIPFLLCIDEQDDAPSDPLTTDELAIISQSISDWQELARELCLSEDEIHTVFQQKTRTPSEQCLHMLNYWLGCLKRNLNAQQSRSSESQHSTKETGIFRTGRHP